MLQQVRNARLFSRIPPHAWFLTSALSRYFGASLAVLLFQSLGVLGVVWLRLGWATLIFAPMARPWQLFRESSTEDRGLMIAFGISLASMNCCFYFAIARLPVSLVAALEFLGSTVLALYGLRNARNFAAVVLTTVGVFLVIGPKWENNALGLVWAALNAALFVVYVSLGHRIANTGRSSNIRRLGTSMGIAFLVVLPIGPMPVIRSLSHPTLILNGALVAVCSSIVPYVCDQLALVRLSRSTFALMLGLLPASATVIGAAVLGQIPTSRNLVGVGLVMGGVAIHQKAATA